MFGSIAKREEKSYLVIHVHENKKHFIYKKNTTNYLIPTDPHKSLIIYIYIHLDIKGILTSLLLHVQGVAKGIQNQIRSFLKVRSRPVPYVK